MMLGQDHVLLVSAVHHPQLEYVALGHIHRHQVLRHDPPMVVYSGSLQRVDFSEEGDEKGFCVVDLDSTAPQGERMVGFDFHRVQARPFVTIDAPVSSGRSRPHRGGAAGHRQEGTLPTRWCGYAFRCRPRENLSYGEADIRQALSSAHYIAAISREVEGTRRTRLESDAADGLGTMQALRLYLETRGIGPDRREKILRYAQELEASE